MRWRWRRSNRSRSRWWRRRRALRTARGALVANRSELLLTLKVFVKTNGQVLDDVVLNFEAALEFHDQIVVRSADLVVDVDAFAVFGNFVSELASAPMLSLFDLGAFVTAGMLNRVLHFLDFVFRRGRTDDKNQVVQTFFHGSSFLFQLRDCTYKQTLKPLHVRVCKTLKPINPRARLKPGTTKARNFPTSNSFYIPAASSSC